MPLKRYERISMKHTCILGTQRGAAARSASAWIRLWAICMARGLVPVVGGNFQGQVEWGQVPPGTKWWSVTSPSRVRSSSPASPNGAFREAISDFEAFLCGFCPSLLGIASDLRGVHLRSLASSRRVIQALNLEIYVGIPDTSSLTLLTLLWAMNAISWWVWPTRLHLDASPAICRSVFQSSETRHCKRVPSEDTFPLIVGILSSLKSGQIVRWLPSPVAGCNSV